MAIYEGRQPYFYGELMDAIILSRPGSDGEM